MNNKPPFLIAGEDIPRGAIICTHEEDGLVYMVRADEPRIEVDIEPKPMYLTELDMVKLLKENLTVEIHQYMKVEGVTLRPCVRLLYKQRLLCKTEF
jgi:hypothetical protein